MKSPLSNAVFAAGYIVVLVSVLNEVGSMVTLQKTIFIPIVMISLFVLSAAVMGFLFVYEPIKLLFENKNDQAVAFFFKTLITFAVFLAIFVLMLFSRI